MTMEGESDESVHRFRRKKYETSWEF